MSLGDPPPEPPPAGLFADATGDPDDRPVVFLHGIAAAGWMWWRQLPALPGHFRLTVDLPGHGRSRDIPWVSLADTAEWVAALIRERTTTGRAHIVGLSLGGHVALALLEHIPSVVDHAVISGVTAAPWPARLLAGPQAWLTTTMLRSHRLLDAQARALSLPPSVHAEFAAGVRAVRPRTYRRIVQEVAAYRAPASLGTPGTPTLVLAGANETEAIRRAVRSLPAAMPVAEGRIAPHAGHGWNVDQPDLFNETMRAWLTDSPLPAALGRI
ncbi:MAG TPA: alpha/beta fold hydrolase [Actinoplanes sp.]|jgi:pimeloyl-ACP methyl ester carboxylesterase